MDIHIQAGILVCSLKPPFDRKNIIPYAGAVVKNSLQWFLHQLGFGAMAMYNDIYYGPVHL